MKLAYWKLKIWLIAHLAALDLTITLNLNPIYWKALIGMIQESCPKESRDESFELKLFLLGLTIRISYVDAGVLNHALRHRYAYKLMMPELHPEDCDKYER